MKKSSCNYNSRKHEIMTINRDRRWSGSPLMKVGDPKFQYSDEKVDNGRWSF